MKGLFCLLSFILLTASVSFATTVTFSDPLSGANENPTNTSPGTGNVLVTLDTTQNTLFVNVTFSGLEGTTTAAHIHCCGAEGTNDIVATTLPSFAGFPLGVTSGTYMQTLDLTNSSSYNPAFVTANGGTVASAEAALASGLENRLAYLNIHTTTFPSGEIRAFLTPVPEPASVLLAALAFGALGLVARKRA